MAWGKRGKIKGRGNKRIRKNKARGSTRGKTRIKINRNSAEVDTVHEICGSFTGHIGENTIIIEGGI